MASRVREIRLGEDARYVGLETALSSAIDTTQRKPKTLISLRLQKGLIDDLKALAKIDGIRYQTLINQVLTKAANEMKADK